MKNTNVIVLAFLIGSVAVAASAQNAPAKQGNGPALKAQPQKAVQQVPNTYGTTSTSFYRMGGSEFTGLGSTSFGVDDYLDTAYQDGLMSFRRFGNNFNRNLIGSPHLPSGAKLVSIRVNGCFNVPGSVTGAVYSCNFFGGACTALVNISANPGCGFDYYDLSSAGFVVDNGPLGNQLVISLHTDNTDGTDSIAGATIEYQLQVSPAPGSATFPDVPVSDFGFQYVEALAASGITGGCGGGLYCPDNPVTRRQMAIFIAKALGLHFQ